MKTTPPWPVLRCQRPGHPSSPWRLLCPSLPCTHVALFRCLGIWKTVLGLWLPREGRGAGCAWGREVGCPIQRPWVRSQGLGQLPRAPVRSELGSANPAGSRGPSEPRAFPLPSL